MKRKCIYSIITAVFLVIIILQTAYAQPTNIDKLKEYDFEQRDSIQKNSSLARRTFTFVIYLGMFILIALLAYFTAKGVAKTQFRSRSKSKYMELIDCLPLGNSLGIYIIKAPQGLLLIGVSPQGISLLEKIDDDKAELIYEAEGSQPYIDKNFAGHLDQFLNNLKHSSTQNKNGDLNEKKD